MRFFRELMSVVCFLAFFPGIFSSENSYAVEAGSIQITDRMSVVGVIAGGEVDGKQTGVVVLKDTSSDKTFTLAIGARLPSDPQFFIKRAGRRQVTVSDGSEEVTLVHIEESDDSDSFESDNTADEPDTTWAGIGNANRSRFADNYYDAFPKAGQHLDPENVPMPFRFGNMTEDEFRERMEAFRGASQGSDDLEDRGQRPRTTLSNPYRGRVPNGWNDAPDSRLNGEESQGYARDYEEVRDDEEVERSYEEVLWKDTVAAEVREDPQSLEEGNSDYLGEYSDEQEQEEYYDANNQNEEFEAVE